MEAIILIGRILFSLIFVGAGIGHLADEKSTTATAEAAGLPNPKLMGQISGVLMLIGGLAVITGFWIDLALLGIAALMLVLNFTMHKFWELEGMEQQMQMSMFMKNLSIAGGALVMFGFYAYGWTQRPSWDRRSTSSRSFRLSAG